MNGFSMVGAVSMMAGSLCAFGCGDDDRVMVDSGGILDAPMAQDLGDGDTGSTPMDMGGVDPSRTIGSLTLDEARGICEDFIAAQGTPGTMSECDNGVTYTVQTTEACADSIEAATCDNRVSELKDCIDALDGDPCLLFSEPACSFIGDCASSS